MACIEAKQSVIPFNKGKERDMEPGDLTHVNVWGKYDVASINKFQYYLLFVDDTSQYVTVEFLKTKDQVAPKVKNYFTHLEVKGMKPKAMHIDHGWEFINKNLLQWCYAKGMEVHMTAPYSPSQNSIVECMNQTLEELAQVMWLVADLLVFLWEHAIAHAVYIHNRAYSSALKTSTPYKCWHSHKPDVSHLCEFGTLVWILLQGQKIPPKMEAKSKWHALVGYDNRSKSVKYYNAETWLILTLRNFHFLEPSETSDTLEQLLIAPDDVACKGESWDDTRNTMDTWIVDAEPGPSSSRKRPAEDDAKGSLRKTRGKRVDYKHLDDPFSDDEAMSTEELTNLLEGDLNQPTFEQAKWSAEWPEWEKAI